MDIKLTSAGTIKPGNYIIMDGAPCVVKSVQTSRPGKHGHAKCRIEAIGMIDDQKRIAVYPGHDKVQIPIIEKKNAQVLSLHENIANVMDLETYETFDLKIPDELKGSLTEGSQGIYWKVMNEKVMKQIK